MITSPGFPQLYRNGIDCTWNIQLSSGLLIHFFFLQFDVEDDYAYGCGWDTSASDIFPTKLIVGFYHAKKLILILVLIHWLFMMVIQIHHPCWEIHIVVIPCHPAESLQVTISSFIFILILISLELASNWNTMQQVRIPTIQVLDPLTLDLRKRAFKLNFFKAIPLPNHTF